MTISARILTSARDFLKYVEREKARQQLLSLSDMILDDIGVSRQLLLAGNKAFPWRLKDANNVSEVTTKGFFDNLVQMNSIRSVETIQSVETEQTFRKAA